MFWQGQFSNTCPLDSYLHLLMVEGTYIFWMIAEVKQKRSKTCLYEWESSLKNYSCMRDIRLNVTIICD